VLLAYALACLPILALRGWDPSIFIHAGSLWVDPAATTPPIAVKPNNGGYDGQFYYRLATAPTALTPRANGILFDHPAKRATRILYPALAWLAAFGQPAATPWAMLVVNLAGLCAIAWLAARLTARWSLPAWVPYAITLWPGFIVSLTHDTTEITAGAFLLAALNAYLSRRPLAFALCASAAVLARETTLLACAGLLAASLLPLARRPARLWLPACAAPLLTFLAWHETLAALWHESPQAQGAAHDLGPPFLGALTMLAHTLHSARHWATRPITDTLQRLYILASATPLIAVCILTARRLRPALRHPALAPIGLAWIATATLMSLLTANGPWIDPDAYLRAFTECWLLGTLVLAAANVPAPRWALALGATQTALAWAYCMAQLR
jgi:hypothetical protein